MCISTIGPSLLLQKAVYIAKTKALLWSNQNPWKNEKPFPKKEACLRHLSQREDPVCPQKGLFL